MEDLNRLLQDNYNEIWINGRFLALHSFAHSCSFLYGVDGKFVELIYDKEQGRIVCVSYADDKDVEKYLDDIDLGELLKAG